MRINRNDAIKAACLIADEQGMSALTLKAVAQRLGIRPPSLYNHVDSLEMLLHLTAQQGMEEMNSRMKNSAVGSAGKEALFSIAEQYLCYMTEHAGVYEVIQWATWHSNDKTAALFGEYLSLLKSVIEKCGFEKEASGELCDIFSGFLHGYCTMQLRYALLDRESAVNRLRDAVDTVFCGMKTKFQ